MTMTRTEIRTFANLLAHSMGDTTMLDEFFDDTLDQLAQLTAPFVDTSTFSPTDGTSEYSYPSAARRILAVFEDSLQLPEVSSKELEAYDEAWRATAAAEGTAVAFTVYERDARKFLLFPTPDTTNTDGGTILYTTNRTTDIPEWLALPIAFSMLAREFAYISDHQDLQFAQACADLAKLFYAFCGL